MHIYVKKIAFRQPSLISIAHRKVPEVDGFPVPNSDGLVLIGLAVCWGSRDAYYLSLQQEQSEG